MGSRSAGWVCVLLVALAVHGCAAPDVDSALVIVVDTLRADALGVMGYGRPTTPEIDDWARRARIYDNAYSSAPWTLPAFGTLLTGTWPVTHGAGHGDRRSGAGRDFAALRDDIPTVATTLAAAGWRTAAFINNTFLAPRFRLQRGFRTWDYQPASIDGYRRADEVVDGALTWLRHHGGERTFLLVHLFDPHLPYAAPEPYLDRWGGAAARDEVSREVREIRSRLRSGTGVPIDTLRAAYDEEVRFTDAQVGRLLRGLADLGLDRRTVVVLTADHGEEFQDHGGFEHGHTLYEELLRVPLVLAVPGEPPARVSEPVSIVDIAPTLLELLGVAADDRGPGVSLLRPQVAGERTLVAEDLLYGPPRRAAIRWPWKLKVDGRRARLYRLDRDRDETRDVADRHRDIVAALRQDLAASAERAAESRKGVNLDAETERNLRSLGYVD